MPNADEAKHLNNALDFFMDLLNECGLGALLLAIYLAQGQIERAKMNPEYLPIGSANAG